MRFPTSPITQLPLPFRTSPVNSAPRSSPPSTLIFNWWWKCHGRNPKQNAQCWKRQLNAIERILIYFPHHPFLKIVLFFGLSFFFFKSIHLQSTHPPTQTSHIHTHSRRVLWQNPLVMKLNKLPGTSVHLTALFSERFCIFTEIILFDFLISLPVWVIYNVTELTIKQRSSLLTHTHTNTHAQLKEMF